MTIDKLHRRALEATRPLVAATGGDQLDLPTPNEEWDVRALLNHLVAGNWWAAELAAGKTIEEVGDRLDGDVLGPDPLDAYDASAEAAAKAFEVPGALEAPCAVSYGPVPGEMYAGHRFLDVLLHGWDLAKATGQPTDLDPALVAGALEVLTPQWDLMRSSGAFATDVPVPEGGDPQTRLLAMTGRRP
ncbi:MAG: TIGR03086 family metal-binding protein [Mycobacteriales bacterium]